MNTSDGRTLDQFLPQARCSSTSIPAALDQTVSRLVNTTGLDPSNVHFSPSAVMTKIGLLRSAWIITIIVVLFAIFWSGRAVHRCITPASAAWSEQCALTYLCGEPLINGRALDQMQFYDAACTTTPRPKR